MPRYAIIIESGPGNFSAYVPDLPGCFTTGATLEEVKANMREAIQVHLDGLRADGAAIPKPTIAVDYIEA